MDKDHNDTIGTPSNMKYRRFFKHYWTEQFPWLVPGKTPSAQAFCRYCDSKVQLRKSSFLTHQNTSKHRKKYLEYMKSEHKVFKTFTNGLEPKYYGRASSSKEHESLNARKVVNLDGSTYFVKSEEEIIGLEAVDESTGELTDHRINQLVSDVGERFNSDLKNFMELHPEVMHSIQRETSSMYFGDAGLQRMKKVVVSHMAQQYLSETTTSLWKTVNSQETLQSQLSTKLENIALQISRSLHEMNNVKTTLKEVEDMEPDGELLLTI